MLVLVILGLIWGFVLIPPYLQTRRESRPSDSIASFRQQLSVLERTTPGAGRATWPASTSAATRSPATTPARTSASSPIAPRASLRLRSPAGTVARRDAPRRGAPPSP